MHWGSRPTGALFCRRAPRRHPEYATLALPRALAAAVGGLLGTGIYGFLDILPPEIKVTYKPILNNIMLAVGATTAIAGGGIGTMMAIPKILEAMRGNAAQASTALASLSSGPTSGPVANQAGGGEENNNGIPSLGDVANDILNNQNNNNNNNNNKNNNNNNQKGGGAKGAEYSSSIFLGILVLSALGGMSLALIRSKSVSSS